MQRGVYVTTGNFSFRFLPFRLSFLGFVQFSGRKFFQRGDDVTPGMFGLNILVTSKSTLARNVYKQT